MSHVSVPALAGSNIGGAALIVSLGCVDVVGTTTGASLASQGAPPPPRTAYAAGICPRLGSTPAYACWDVFHGGDAGDEKGSAWPLVVGGEAPSRCRDGVVRRPGGVTASLPGGVAIDGVTARRPGGAAILVYIWGAGRCC